MLYNFSLTNLKSRFYHQIENLKSQTFGDGIIDTHCHLDFLFQRLKFEGNFQEFLTKANGLSSFPNSFEGCIAIFCKPENYNKVILIYACKFLYVLKQISYQYID